MLPEKQQAVIKEKVFAVQCEKDLNQTKKRDFGSTRDNAGLAAMQQAVQSKVNVVNIGMEASIERDQSIENLNEAQAAARAEIFERNKLIVIEKAHIKDWQIKEVTLQAMQECFENATPQIIKENQEFVTTCIMLLK